MSNQGKEVMHHLVQFDEMTEVMSHGVTRSTVRLKSGIQVDLRVIKKDQYGAALLYFTGSKAHNIALRKMAIQNQWKMNEYAIFKGKKQLAGQTHYCPAKLNGLKKNHCPH